MTRHFRRHPATIYRRLSDGVVVLSLADDEEREPVYLAGTGGDLWDVLAEPGTIHELADALAERFDQPSDVIARDLGPVLDELVAGGLVALDHTWP